MPLETYQAKAPWLVVPVILGPTTILHVTKCCECVCPTRSSLRILFLHSVSLETFLFFRKLNQFR